MNETSSSRGTYALLRTERVARRLDHAVWLLAIALSVGCGASAHQAGAASSVTVERLYPMRPGSVWTYDVDTGEGLPVLAITRVLAASNGQVEVSSGSDSLHYEQRAEGLFRVDVSSYLLKSPLTAGAQWEGHDGGRAEITRIDARASTPAGDFANCLEVVETGGPSDKRVRTVFCPDVGPVEIESSLHIQLTGKSTRVLAKLRGYDFSGALVGVE